MDWMYHPPMSHIVATSLLLFGVTSAIRGLRFLFLGIYTPDHPCGPLRVVRGLRGVIVALAVLVWAVAILSRKEWLFRIGAIVLVQELYEMGFLSVILRAGRKAEKKQSDCRLDVNMPNC